MTIFSRALRYFKTRKTLKYRLYKFLLKHSKAVSDSPIILIWEFGGFSDILKKNAIISAALNFRGYRTHFIVCDGVPEACIQRGYEHNEDPKQWDKKCPKCLFGMRSAASMYSVNYSTAGEFITEKVKKELSALSENIDISKIYDYKYLGVGVGILAWSSFVRYMKGYVIEAKDLKKEYEYVYRKYFYAGLVNTYIAERVIEQFKPHSVFCSHGVYVDYSPVILLAYLIKIKALCWSSGYKILLHYFTVPKKPNKLELRGITEEEWKKRGGTPLTEKENKILDKYIYERFNKALKTDFLNVSAPESPESLKKKLGIENSNKIACIFCHVAWDLSFDLSTMIFDNANQWFDETMKTIFEVKDVNWIVRVHPGEKASGSLYTLDSYIRDNYRDIPSHIKILWSDSEINSFGLYKLIDTGITLFGTTGAELPLFGKNIITAGEAYFAGKGFTYDAKNREEYYSLLRNTGKMGMLNEHQIELARRYAYSFFIQRQIPINVINKSHGHFGDLDPDKMTCLLPGNDIIIDEICSGIINGKDVIMNEEMVDMITDTEQRNLPL
ncbi:MAG: hypothetical protein HGGPFJEG_02601 [Ignavibacteria bacterium]|nr:hypothetical protein [Ignavibacteria bacterium]